MFCPRCHAEYRSGFTACADCETELVPTLASKERETAISNRQGPLVPLWEGDHLALHTLLLEALDNAKIPYFTKPLSIYPGVRRSDQFPIEPLMRFGYKVAVLRSDFPAADLVLKKLLEESPQDVALVEEADPVLTVAAPKRADEAPTSEIWSGQSKNFSSFLQDALRENEIALRVDAVNGADHIFVCPSSVARAKEIVRELTEAAPPQ